MRSILWKAVFTVNILLNGRSRTAPRGETLAELLDDEKIAKTNLLVEYNGEILSAPEQWAKTVLGDGDEIHLFSLVAGG